MKLHLGCGPRELPGYLHMDQDSYPHVNVVGDIRDLANFEAGSAEIIYACQVINYFDPQELPYVLTEWWRVLQTDGILRLSVPDFERLAQLYIAGIPLDWMQGTLYGRRESDYGMQYHKRTFDYPTLHALLSKAGFHNISLWDPFRELPENYDDLSKALFPPQAGEKYANRERICWNLNMQGIK